MKHVIAQRRKTVYGIIFVVEIEQKQAIWCLKRLLINFLLLYLQFCDHSKRILTLNHAVKESTPNARGLV